MASLKELSLMIQFIGIFVRVTVGTYVGSHSTASFLTDRIKDVDTIYIQKRVKKKKGRGRKLKL
jgi:hypothetical protein